MIYFEVLLPGSIRDTDKNHETHESSYPGLLVDIQIQNSAMQKKKANWYNSGIFHVAAALPSGLIILSGCSHCKRHSHEFVLRVDFITHPYFMVSGRRVMLSIHLHLYLHAPTNSCLVS
jgi:hypothetical protein